MIVTCVRLGYVLTGVPIRTIYSGQKSHISPLVHLANFVRMVWRTRSRRSDGAAVAGPKD